MSDMFDMDEFDRHPADEEPRKTGRSKQHIHQQAKCKIKMCEECGVHPADLPSKLCCGCNSYREHF